MLCCTIASGSLFGGVHFVWSLIMTSSRALWARDAKLGAREAKHFGSQKGVDTVREISMGLTFRKGVKEDRNQY